MSRFVARFINTSSFDLLIRDDRAEHTHSQAEILLPSMKLHLHSIDYHSSFNDHSIQCLFLGNCKYLRR